MVKSILGYFGIVLAIAGAGTYAIVLFSGIDHWPGGFYGMGAFVICVAILIGWIGAIADFWRAWSGGTSIPSIEPPSPSPTSASSPTASDTS